MHARRLNRIANYLGSHGFYKEAYQMKKVAQGGLEDDQKDELDLDEEGLETNNEFENLFPSSPDEEEDDMDLMDDEDDEEDSSLLEYLDEEDLRNLPDPNGDDEDFDPDMESYDSMPHDDDDEEDSSLAEYLDEEGMEPAGEERFDEDEYLKGMGPSDDEMDEFEEMLADRALRRGTKEY